MSLNEYNKALAAYNAQAARAAAGDKNAMKEKAKIAQDLRSIERAAAKDGKIIARRETPGGGTVGVVAKETETKRDLQWQYCQKFDDEKAVKLGGEETTMRKYHRKRLKV